MTYYPNNDIHIKIKDFEDNSIDLIYSSPPYGTTENKWDKKLDWELLFPEIWRVLKPTGILILHCSMPFTYELLKFNTPKYHYTWIKNNSTNFFKAKLQPLRCTEEVMIYYKKPGTYNPQMNGDVIYQNKFAKKNNYYPRITDKKETSYKGRYPNTV